MGSHMRAQPSAILYLSVMDLMMTTWLVETCCLFDTFMVIKEYCCADVLSCMEILVFISTVKTNATFNFTQTTSANVYSLVMLLKNRTCGKTNAAPWTHIIVYLDGFRFRIIALQVHGDQKISFRLTEVCCPIMVTQNIRKHTQDWSKI